MIFQADLMAAEKYDHVIVNLSFFCLSELKATVALVCSYTIYTMVDVFINFGTFLSGSMTIEQSWSKIFQTPKNPGKNQHLRCIFHPF